MSEYILTFRFPFLPANVSSNPLSLLFSQDLPLRSSRWSSYLRIFIPEACFLPLSHLHLLLWPSSGIPIPPIILTSPRIGGTPSLKAGCSLLQGLCPERIVGKVHYNKIKKNLIKNRIMNIF